LRRVVRGRYVYIASFGSVRRVSPGSDRLTTPAGTGARGPLGDGGRATQASLVTCGVTVNHSGNLVIADFLNERVRVVAHTTGTFYGQPMTAGDIYTVAGNGGQGYSGDGGPATSAELFDPEAVAVDATGNVLIADLENHRVRVVAAGTGSFYGQAMTAGDIYTAAGNGTLAYSGDGGPAMKAEFDGVHGVALDQAGSLIIADTANHRVRAVAASTGSFYTYRP
jgi:hypothetical protein